MATLQVGKRTPRPTWLTDDVQLFQSSQSDKLALLQRCKTALEADADLSIQAMADSLNIDRSTLSNGIRLLELPELVLDLVRSEILSLHAARDLLPLLKVAGTELVFSVLDQASPDYRVERIRELVGAQLELVAAPRGRMGNGRSKQVTSAVEAREPAVTQQRMRIVPPKGTPITSPVAGKKYGIGRTTVAYWAKGGLVAVLDPGKGVGSKAHYDEHDVVLILQRGGPPKGRPRKGR